MGLTKCKGKVFPCRSSKTFPWGNILWEKFTQRKCLYREMSKGKFCENLQHIGIKNVLSLAVFWVKSLHGNLYENLRSIVSVSAVFVSCIQPVIRSFNNPNKTLCWFVGNYFYFTFLLKIFMAHIISKKLLRFACDFLNGLFLFDERRETL